jgi:hypothetical protein
MRSLYYLWLLVLWLLPVVQGEGDPEIDFMLLGVSGTLQDGFELRHRLNYRHPQTQMDYPAQFVGTALVPGYKAYLDVKDKGFREYREANPPTVPNAVVMPTGCAAHANIYHVFFVPTPVLLNVLAGEPRFLSITPDTGLVDLQADETSDTVRRVAQSVIKAQHKRDDSRVAIPLVTGVWFHDTFVESPPVYVRDGTKVTSFDGGLAVWAGVEREDLVDADATAWANVHTKIRQLERQAPKGIRPGTCRQIRFGVSDEQARLNFPFTSAQVEALLAPNDSEHSEL